MKHVRTEQGRVRLLSLGIILAVAALLLSPIQVWAWGSATHAHVADNLGASSGQVNLNEIYGAMGLDSFNFLFGSPYQAQLDDLAHHQSLKVWQAAQGGSQAALAAAYGFMSHNDDWGADYTAHHHGRYYGLAEGYVIAKTNELVASSPILAGLGLPDAVATELAYMMVETGVDVLIQPLNPQIGQKIMDSTVQRTSQFPALLVQAYANELPLPYLDAAALIQGAEAQFNDLMYWYGYALTFPQDAAVQLLAGQFADLASLYLASYGIDLPLPKDEIALILGNIIGEAMILCQADFAEEIRLTISFVDDQLSQHGVTPVPLPSSIVMLAPFILGLGWQTRRHLA